MEVKKNDYVLQKENERLQAENFKLKAQLDYVAMMTDVDLPDDDEREVPEND